MAKSKLIKEIISDQISLTQAFDRLIVIAMELDDTNLLAWAKKEKNGYSSDDEIPEYRKISLRPIGTYQLIGGGYIQTYKNQTLATIGVDDDFKETISSHYETSSIPTIESNISEIEKGNTIGIPIPPEMFYMFEEGTNAHLLNAVLAIDKNALVKIIDCTKTKLIEILTLLEKNFGSLDSFDIDARDYDTDEMSTLKDALSNIIKDKPNTNIYIISNSKVKGSNIGENTVNKPKEVEISPSISIEKGEQDKENFFIKIIKFIFRKR